MIVSRCIACFLEYPQNAPAFCRCGSSTFTTIHKEDDEPEAPTTSPDGGRSLPGAGIAAGVLGHLQSFGPHSSGPAAVASTSGPTPPPSVSESSPGSASAPQPGAADEPGDDSEADELGGVTCGQEGCEKSATHKFFWPSPDEPSTRYACEEHAKRAEEIAPSLGFSADVQPLV